MWRILHAALPSSLPGGPIVYGILLETLKDMNPGSITQLIE
jgi:hypothetical protein